MNLYLIILLALYTLNNKEVNKFEQFVFCSQKEIFIVLLYLGIQSVIVTQQLRSCVNKFCGCFDPKTIFRNTRQIKSFSPHKDRLSRFLRCKVVDKASCWDYDDCYIGKTKHRLHERKPEHFKALTNNSHSSAIADHMTQTGHRIKWDHFDILATGQSDIHCKIKETLLIHDLKPPVENVCSEKLLLYQPFIFFSSRFNQVCLFSLTFSLSLLSLFGFSLRV